MQWIHHLAAWSDVRQPAILPKSRNHIGDTAAHTFRGKRKRGPNPPNFLTMSRKSIIFLQPPAATWDVHAVHRVVLFTMSPTLHFCCHELKPGSWWSSRCCAEHVKGNPFRALGSILAYFFFGLLAGREIITTIGNRIRGEGNEPRWRLLKWKGIAEGVTLDDNVVGACSCSSVCVICVCAAGTEHPVLLVFAVVIRHFQERDLVPRREDGDRNREYLSCLLLERLL